MVTFNHSVLILFLECHYVIYPLYFYQLLQIYLKTCFVPIIKCHHGKSSSTSETLQYILNYFSLLSMAQCSPNQRETQFHLLLPLMATKHHWENLVPKENTQVIYWWSPSYRCMPFASPVKRSPDLFGLDRQLAWCYTLSVEVVAGVLNDKCSLLCDVVFSPFSLHS